MGESLPRKSFFTYRTWILVLLIIFALPILYISTVIVNHRAAEQQAREKSAKIPRAQKIDDFISYKIPDGWTKKDFWFMREKKENKLHQFISLLSPEYNSPLQGGCHISISARKDIDPNSSLKVAYYVNKSGNVEPYGQKEMKIDGFNAVSYYEDFLNHKQTLLIAQTNPDGGDQRLWSLLFMCKDKEDLENNREIITTFIDSIKFK